MQNKYTGYLDSKGNKIKTNNKLYHLPTDLIVYVQIKEEKYYVKPKSRDSYPELLKDVHTELEILD